MFRNKTNSFFEDTNTLNNIDINGKQSRLKFQKCKNKENITRPLFTVHSDVCGPISTIDNTRMNYYVVFIDQYTHYWVTCLITYTSDVFFVIKDFVARSEAHLNLKIVNFCTEYREYLVNETIEFCVETGISYNLTVPHTPQLNGVSKRMI